MNRTHPNTFQVWFRALRFPSLTASLIAVMLGGGFAILDRAFHGLPFLIALVGAMLLQAGSNLLNDYFDHKAAIDQDDLLAADNVLQRGWLTPAQVLVGGLACYALALFFGIYFALELGTQILWFGLIGLFLGFLYTGGPFPLAYKALGELAVFFAMGPMMVLGTYYVQVGTFRWEVFVGSIPVGLLVAAITYTNNLRDRDHDRRVGKLTIANLLSLSGAKRGLAILLFSAYLIQFTLVYIGLLSWYTLITAIALPVMVGILRTTAQAKTPLEMNLIVGFSVLLHLLYGVLYTLGLFVASILG